MLLRKGLNIPANLVRRRSVNISPASLTNNNIQSLSTSTLSLLSSSKFRFYSSTSNADDRFLRTAFDTPQSLRSTTTTANTTKPGGLFRHSNIKHPEDFKPLAERTVQISNVLLERFINPETPYSASSPVDSFLRGVKVMDRLSDTLCRVTDFAECVRTLHPDPNWVNAAHEAYENLVHYMNILNTHKELYATLDRLYQPVANMHSPPKDSQFTHAIAAALHFLHDFRRSGIHLPEEANRTFVKLSSDIISLGRDFFDPPQTSIHNVSVSSSELSIFGPQFMQLAAGEALPGSDNQNLIIDGRGWIGSVISRQHPDQALRKRLWTAANRTDPQHVDILENLLAVRANLAKSVDSPSFAHFTLSDKMAATPDNVNAFLTSLFTANDPHARKDISSLINARDIYTSTKGPEHTLYPWDSDFFTMLSKSSDSNSQKSIRSLPEYFSVGTCIQGLSRIFQRLYGVSFQVEDLNPGEVWFTDNDGEPAVVRLGVYDDTKGRIGTIYADLWEREGKNTGGAGTAAHYTIRCSRRVDDDQVSQAEIEAGWLGNEYRGEEYGVDIKGESGSWQTPIVVLTTNFEKPSKLSPTCLQWIEVETLFHEVGHAIHSMLGRSPYHNCAGTRCATDFVEFPSILMEYLLQSQDLLSLFARHYSTDLPLPKDIITSNEQFPGLENARSILLATVDQAFHTSEPLSANFNSTTITQAIQNQRGAGIPAVEGTSWQTQFTHLYTYGSTYYSYLLDRVLAARAYSSVFQNGSLVGREQGEKLKNDVLRWGGGREGWQCIADLLGGADGDALRSGPRAAMEKAGSWGLHDALTTKQPPH